MTSIQITADFFAAGLLLATFLMMGKVRLIPMLRYFAIASFFLAGLGICVSIIKGHTDFIAPLATIVFKVIVIPAIIHLTSKKIPSSNQLRMYVRPATSYFLFALVLIISAIIVRNFPIDFSEHEIKGIFFFKSLLFISMALMLSGILLTIIRKDLFSQVLGLLTMENGIAAFGLVALKGMPLFLEMGIFFVIIISTVILAILTYRVHQIFATGDTEKLKELID